MVILLFVDLSDRGAGGRKILTVADLKGKTIGTQTLTSAAYYSQERWLKDVASTRTRM